MTIALAILLPYLYSAAFYALLPQPRAVRVFALSLFVLLAAATPLVIPAELRFTRYFLGVCAFAHFARAVDIHFARKPPSDWKALFGYLINPFLLVYEARDAERARSGSVEIGRMRRGLVWLVFGAVSWVLVVELEIGRGSFWLEHGSKLVSFYVGLYGALTVLVAAVRLLGVPARYILDNPFIACTPADFWRRYNRIVGQWLHERVFKKVGGRRAPVIATLITFFVSGVIHEALADVALGNVQGYQLAFFMLQGIGVALTLRVRPKSAVALSTGVALTFLFNFASSALFFATIAQLVPYWPSWPSLIA